MPVTLLLALSLPPFVPFDAEADPAYRKWRDLVASGPHVVAEFRRIEYDDVFEIEKHSGGRVVWNGPDDWRLEIEPIEFDKGTQGNRYRIVPDDEQCWIRRDDVLLTGSGVETFSYPLTRRTAPDPNVARSNALVLREFEDGMRSGMQVLSGLLPNERIASARVVGHRHTDRGPGSTHVVLTPDARLSRQWKSCDLLLAPDGRPVAMRLRNPADTGATVYVFDRWDASVERHPNELPAER